MTTSHLKVSVITPSYNQGQFIEQTILSVLNQSYPNIEYILVDGGSTDNTMEIVKKYKERISIIIHEKDNGQSDAINKGFKLATGELVGWINSDDILYQDCIERIVEMEEKHRDGSIYYASKIDILNVNGNVKEQRVIRISNKNDLLNKNYDVIQQGSFYRSELIKEVDFLDQKLYYCMDLDLWLKLLDRGKIYFFDNYPLAAFRLWEGNKTLTGQIDFLKDIRKTLCKHGMSAISHNNKRLHWYLLKKKIKSVINRPWE